MNNNIITWYPGPRAPRPLPARGGGAGPPAAGLARDRGHAHDGEALVTGVGGAVLAVEIWTWLLVPGSSDIYHHYLEVSPGVGHLAVLGVRQLGALSLRPGGGHVNMALNFCQMINCQLLFNLLEVVSFIGKKQTQKSFLYSIILIHLMQDIPHSPSQRHSFLSFWQSLSCMVTCRHHTATCHVSRHLDTLPHTRHARGGHVKLVPSRAVLFPSEE